MSCDLLFVFDAEACNLAMSSVVCLSALEGSGGTTNSQSLLFSEPLLIISMPESESGFSYIGGFPEMIRSGKSSRSTKEAVAREAACVVS